MLTLINSVQHHQIALVLLTGVLAVIGNVNVTAIGGTELGILVEMATIAFIFFGLRLGHAP